MNPDMHYNDDVSQFGIRVGVSIVQELFHAGVEIGP